MSHPLSLDDYGYAAIAELDADPEATVAGVAEFIGISDSVIYRLWRKTRPGTTPRGQGSGERQRFAALCDLVAAQIGNEDMGTVDIFGATRVRAGGLNDRTLYRALRKLVEDGRVIRSGGRCSAMFRRAPNV